MPSAPPSPAAQPRPAPAPRKPENESSSPAAARHQDSMRRIAAAFLLALFSGVALSQYPTKPVRVVLHFPAGGSTDVVTRILANALGEAMGQPFIVENKLGADGAIAAAQVMQSPP